MSDSDFLKSLHQEERDLFKSSDKEGVYLFDVKLRYGLNGSREEDQIQHMRKDKKPESKSKP